MYPIGARSATGRGTLMPLSLSHPILPILPSTLRITCLPHIGAAHHTVVLCSSSGLGLARINLRLLKFGACRRRSAVSAAAHTLRKCVKLDSGVRAFGSG